MEFHPLAELFPLMEGAEFEALVADILRHGLREPITLHAHKILDGRNRFRACEQAKILPIFEQWDCEGDIQAFVVSKNLHRRHLNESQRAIIAAKLANIPRGTVGGGHKKTDTQITISDAAELLNVSRSLVHEAKTVLTQGTHEEIEAAEKGEAAVGTLGRQIRASVPKTKRAKIREQSLSHAGKNPERIQRQQMQAEIWAKLSDALSGLSALPLPADVMEIVNNNVNRRRFVDDRLPRAVQWITEFSDAWSAND